jgi:hypothetical protein
VSTGSNVVVEEPTRKPPIARVLVGILVCLAPLVISFVTPLRPDTALVYIGLLPTFVALPSGPRVALGTAGATAVAVFVGLLVSHSPGLATVLMVAMGIGVAYAHTRGWQAPATYVATQAGLAAVAAPAAHAIGEHTAQPWSLSNAATVAVVTLVAGLWVAVAGSLTMHGLAAEPGTRSWDKDLIVFAATLAVLLGVATFVLMQYTSGGNAWWILLTLLVSVAPTAAGSVSRALQRAGGTIVGGAVAAVLVVGIDGRGVLIALGFVAAVVSAVSYVKAPYWVFALFLTLALVLLTFPEGRVLKGDLERVAFTVVAALVVIVVSIGVDAVLRRYDASRPSPSLPS